MAGNCRGCGLAQPGHHQDAGRNEARPPVLADQRAHGARAESGVGELMH
jgi:hypothetical protein